MAQGGIPIVHILLKGTVSNLHEFDNSSRHAWSPEIEGYEAAVRQARADLTAFLQAACGDSVASCAAADASRLKSPSAKEAFYNVTAPGQGGGRSPRATRCAGLSHRIQTKMSTWHGPYARTSWLGEDDAGRMMMQMVGSFAEFERAMIRKRASTGIAVARAKGRIGGRRRKLYSAKRREIAEIVISGRKSGAAMARLYSVSQPTVSRIVAEARSEQTAHGKFHDV